MKKLQIIVSFIFIFIGVTLNLSAATTLSSDNATHTITDQNSSLFGYSVSYLGKITNSLGNFYAISAPFDGSSGQFDSGKLYLFEESIISKNTLTTSNATIIIQGTEKDAETGLFIAAGGDLDKDGLNDFVLIYPNLTSNQIKIYLGKYYNNWTTTTIVTISDPNLGIEQTSNRYLSSNLASISGDLNGDGYDDLVIGLTRNTDNTNPSGKAAIIYGSRDIESANNTLTSAANHFITGQTTNEGFGYSVSILNDINQDGYDELLISAFNESTELGKVVGLQYGAFTSIFPVSSNAATTYTYSSMDALFFSPTNGTDGFGQFVQGIGDINNDGFGDFAISAPKSGVSNGSIYIYNGSQTNFSGSYTSTNPASATLSLSNSYFLGLQGITGKYDLTGDGVHNLVLSQHLANTDGGSVYVLDSSKTYSGTLDFNSSIDFQINNSKDSGKFGHSLATGGDLNKDGISDLLIGTNGFDNNNGSAFLYQLNSTATANSTTIKLYSDANFSSEVSSSELNNTIYVQITGNDPNASQVNILEVQVESGSSSKKLTLQAIETAVNSGIYRTNFFIIGTRTDTILKQILCSKSDTVKVYSTASALNQTTFSVTNSLPLVSNVSIQQIGSTTNTQIYVSYDLIDLNNDSVSFATSGSVQYSSDNGTTWQNATVDSGNSVVDAKNQVQAFNLLNKPLILTNFSNYNGSLKVRIRGNDSTSFSSFSESSAITVDNEAPSAATIYSINPKYSYNIIVTGNAEPLSTILIYNEGNYKQSIQTPSSGVFEITNFPVSVTENSITVYVKDEFNFISPISNQIDLTFSNRSMMFSENSFIVSSNIALGATLNETLISYTNIDASALPQVVPSLYNYINSFSFTPDNVTYDSFSKPITHNVTFSSELASKNGLSVFLYNPNSNTWESSQTSLINSSTTALSFSSNYLGRFLVAQLKDLSSPSITNVQINGTSILNNQYYGSSFSLTATLSDLDSTISSYNISIISDTTNNVVSSFKNVYSSQDAQKEVSISVNPTNLTTDTYTLTITTEDQFTNKKQSQYYFKVNTNQLNFDILAGPNPVNFNKESLVFGYNISQNIDMLAIYILDQRGNIIFQEELSNVTAGYSTYSFNGLNKYSNKLSNGIYYAYCFAKKGDSIVKKRLKIAVLK